MKRYKKKIRRRFSACRRTKVGRYLYFTYRKMHIGFWVRKRKTAEHRDNLFSMLSRVAAILEKHQIRHFLSNGTLLGAVRENDFIPGDTDWDLDCFLEDRAKILGLRHVFAAEGISLVSPYIKNCLDLETQNITPFDSLLIRAIDDKTGVTGDLYLFTAFNDGILRRYSFEDQVLYNPKMSLPAWFYEQPTFVKLRGAKFPAPQAPEHLLKKIYGKDWMVPIERYNTPKGLNFSGAVFDSDIESLIEIALKHEWKVDYSTCPSWPRPVKYTNSRYAIRWIQHHEPLLFTVGGAEPFIPGFVETHRSDPRALARYMLHMNRLRKEVREEERLRKTSKQPESLISDVAPVRIC
jgi:hypothetical protein